MLAFEHLKEISQGELCVGETESLVPDMFRAMIRASGLAGNIFVVTDDNDKILGLSLWYGPGKSMFRDEEQRKLGFDAFRNRLPEAGKNWWDNVYTVEYHEFIQGCLGPEGHLPLWYCHLAAVNPEYQGKGVGTKLVNAISLKAIEDRKPVAVCCATELNREIYQSMGLTLLGQSTLSGFEGLPHILSIPFGVTGIRIFIFRNSTIRL